VCNNDPKNLQNRLLEESFPVTIGVNLRVTTTPCTTIETSLIVEEYIQHTQNVDFHK
jgi:hypothetical protein